MNACRACGHRLDDASICRGCGRSVDTGPDWRTDTAERPRVRTGPASREPRLPPSATEPPPAARWPLYADEVPPTSPLDAEDPPMVAGPSWTYRPPSTAADDSGWFAYAADQPDADRRSPLRWVLVALVVVLLVGISWWYLARADGPGPESRPVSGPSAVVTPAG